MNVRLPVNDPPDLNVKLPFELRSRDPLPPPSTSVAVRLSPSGSESLPSTPEAGTESWTPVVALYELLAAVGAAFVTVNLTTAASVTRMPRFSTRASYVKESAPT